MNTMISPTQPYMCHIKLHSLTDRSKYSKPGKSIYVRVYNTFVGGNFKRKLVRRKEITTIAIDG